MIDFNNSGAVGSRTLAAAAGLIGSFTVLRRQAIAGDARPMRTAGFVLGFLVVGNRNLPVMMLGVHRFGWA